MFQTSLRLWQDDYSYPFIDSLDYLPQILSCHTPILLSGPSKSGKKHLAFKVLNLRVGSLFICDFLSDSQIIHYYDSLNSSSFAIFILPSSDFPFSQDVLSRFSSLLHFSIPELSHDSFLFFLSLRLQRFGIVLDDSLLRYVSSRLPCSYFWVDSFVSFLSSLDSISFKMLRRFFDRI